MQMLRRALKHVQTWAHAPKHVNHRAHREVVLGTGTRPRFSMCGMLDSYMEATRRQRFKCMSSERSMQYSAHTAPAWRSRSPASNVAFTFPLAAAERLKAVYSTCQSADVRGTLQDYNS